MPLETSKSKSAFDRNIEKERNAGKPEKQAVAIAYAKQKEATARDQKNEADFRHMTATQVFQKLDVNFRGNSPTVKRK